MKYVIDFAPVPALPVVGSSDLFPVARISAAQALDHVWGYGVGLDMTRRDIQGEAKKLGRPWEMGT